MIAEADRGLDGGYFFFFIFRPHILSFFSFVK